MGWGRAWRTFLLPSGKEIAVAAAQQLLSFNCAVDLGSRALDSVSGLHFAVLFKKKTGNYKWKNLFGKKKNCKAKSTAF